MPALLVDEPDSTVVGVVPPCVCVFCFRERKTVPEAVQKNPAGRFQVARPTQTTKGSITSSKCTLLTKKKLQFVAKHSLAGGRLVLYLAPKTNLSRRYSIPYMYRLNGFHLPSACRP